MSKLIGSAPNQISTNGMLGTMAFEDIVNYPRYNASGLLDVTAPFTVTAGGVNVFKVDSDGLVLIEQVAQASKSAAATLTVAELRTQIVQYTGAAANLQMPTGTDLQTSVGAITDIAFDVSIINTGSGAATVTTNTGLTLVGNMVVSNGASGVFRIRRTGANTFTVYRMS